MERIRKAILIVEDESDLATSLKYNLEKEGGYRVSTASSGEKGLALAREREYDLILLDLMLPGMDGLEVCRAIRNGTRSAQTPIIMLTARVDESDRVVGLEVGADDYVTKPFSMKEILARVRAHIRRRSRAASDGPATYEGAGLRIDFEGHVVSGDGGEVLLTRMEFALLAALVRNRGRVLGRENLLEKVWGYEYYGSSRTVDVHVRRLRKKLGPAGRHIETVFGVGYRFREEGPRDGES